MIDYYIYSRVFHEFTFSTNFPEHVLNISVRQKKKQPLITDWTVYTKNINPSVLRIYRPPFGRSIRQDRTSGFIFFSIDSPTSY